MKPFKRTKDFADFLDRVFKEHEDKRLGNVYLKILEKEEIHRR